MKFKNILLAGIAVLVFVTPAWPGEVQFPTKPIHIWVGFAAGGSTDLLTRTLAGNLEKTLGQPIIVENKPGGGGALCLGLLVSQKPDGYTLAHTSDTPFSRSPHMVSVKYDPMRDFTPIIRMGMERVGVVVKSDSPFKKIEDLIEYARKNTGKLTYSSPGAGTTAHLPMEKLAFETKVKFQHVPFPGDAQAIGAILGGHVMAGVTGIMGWQAHVKAGTLRLLMVFDNQGTEQWPGVSTPKRLGHDFEMGPAFVISAPKGLPEPILNKLVAAFSEAMSSPEYQKLARDWELLYTTPFTGTDFQNWLHNQFKVYGEVIKQVGLEKKE